MPMQECDMPPDQSLHSHWIVWPLNLPLLLATNTHKESLAKDNDCETTLCLPVCQQLSTTVHLPSPTTLCSHQYAFSFSGSPPGGQRSLSVADLEI